MTLNTKYKKKSIFRRLVKSIFLSVYLFVVLLVFVALLSKFVPAYITYIPYLLSLAFPILFIIYLVLIVFVLYRKYYVTFILTFPVFLWALFVFNRYVNFTSLLDSNKCTKDDSLLKVMSFNVRLFDLYNWKGYHKNHKLIIDFIINENPDIACFQEYYYQSDGKYPTTEPILKGLNTSYIHEYYPVINRKKEHFGIATISRFPIINKGVIEFEETSNMSIFSDIVLNSDTIRVYNLHLESVRLGNEDYAFISALENNSDSIELQKTKNIYNRLITAIVKRNKQAEIIAEHVKSCPYPVIVCGDFNDVPASYTYSVISKGLKDSYSLIDIFSMGSTYNGNIPWIRIDYILHSPFFSSCNYVVHKINASDHFPISVFLRKENL